MMNKVIKLPNGLSFVVNASNVGRFQFDAVEVHPTQNSSGMGVNMKIKKIKYFRSDGLDTRPSGLTRGWIEQTIWKNKNGFNNHPMTDSYIESKKTTRYGFSDYRGGMVVFPNGTNTDKSNIKSELKKIYGFINASNDKKIKKIINKWKSSLESDSLYVGGYNIGNNFVGNYKDTEKEVVFNEKSITVELGGIPTEMVLMFAGALCAGYKAPSVLVKDFNTDNNYLIRS